ncbi:MAG TPA: hypothetical protein VIY29_20300 [Ktedonobacteraceae bacterium]
MSEDVTLQPTEDSNASENNHPQASEVASTNEEVPVKPPEAVSEDVPAPPTEETGTNDADPAHLLESESADEEAAVKPPEDSGSGEVTSNSSDKVSAAEEAHDEVPADANLSEKVPQVSDETSRVEETPVESLENTHESETVPATLTDATSTSEDTAAKTADITSSSESTPIKAPARTAKAEPLWFNVVKRVLVGIVLVLIVLGLLIDMTQLVGVWVAYGGTRNSVITVSNTLQQGLQTADKGLTRVDGYVTQARQVVTQVNDVVTLIGDNLQNYSPIITALAQRINTRFGPALGQAQTFASSVHDASLKVNGALEVLNRFPNVNLPTFSDQLAAISNRAQEAQLSMQDLRTTLAQTKTGAATHLATRITTITARTDTALVKIQTIITTYHAKVINAQNRLTATTNQILTYLLVTAISVTILCLIVAAALLLFFWFCLQYVIHGRFPSLRVVGNTGG